MKWLGVCENTFPATNLAKSSVNILREQREGSYVFGKIVSPLWSSNASLKQNHKKNHAASVVCRQGKHKKEKMSDKLALGQMDEAGILFSIMYLIYIFNFFNPLKKTRARRIYNAISMVLVLYAPYSGLISSTLYVPLFLSKLIPKHRGRSKL